MPKLQVSPQDWETILVTLSQRAAVLKMRLHARHTEDERVRLSNALIEVQDCLDRWHTHRAHR
jgi:hypothetical protein